MASGRRSQGCCCQKYADAISRNARLEEEVERLRQENARLRRQLGRVRRTALEKPFGESTPSACRLVKPSMPEPMDENERIRRRGGARHGHKGHVWKGLDTPEECVDAPAPEICPDCGGELTDPPFDGRETRDVVVSHPVKAYVRRYRIRVRYCRHCRRPVRAKVGGVMDGCRYSNSVIAHAATDFYLNGIPVGVVSRSLGVSKGTLLGAFARVARLLEPVCEKACGLIRSSPFAQGDESGWRIGGRNGYTWVFIAGNLIVFVCADSRRSEVAKGVIGEFKGIFTSDRYSGYEFVAGQHSYCLEHLRRDALKVRDDNPQNRECAAYARLRAWQWLIGPEVPADNNRSEREIRPIAVARKVSHGSQSEMVTRERGVFMTVLHTLKACGVDPAQHLEHTLDRYAQDSQTDMFEALFGNIDLKLPVLHGGTVKKLPRSITSAK